MKSGSIFITDYINNPLIEREILGSFLTMELNENITVLLVWHQKIDQEYCKDLPHLKGVVRYGVGYDTLDLPFLKSRNIVACNTPDYGTEEVADTAMAMILNIARGVTRYDFLCRNYNNQTWQENTLPSIRRNSEVKVGVIGAGRIGGSVVIRANQMRFKTLIYDKYKERGYEKLLHTRRVESLDELLTESDIVSIHVPFTEETRGMVNSEFIGKMKQGASLVNTARGGLLESIDLLYEPLLSGQLNCIALDVLPHEPPVHSALIHAWQNREPWLDGRLIINPHTAYFSQEAFVEMRKKAAENALRIINGLEPFNIIS